MKALVEKACADAGLRVPHLAVEPGRAIAGPGTVTVYEVGTVKDLPGLRTYVSVDGGMSDNIRPALYGARYTVALVSRRSAAPAHIVTVVGKHCESGDLVAPERRDAGRSAPGRSARARLQRRLPPVDGQQLQPRPAPAGGGRTRRRRRAC